MVSTRSDLDSNVDKNSGAEDGRTQSKGGIERREFLVGGAAATAGLGLLQTGCAASSPAPSKTHSLENLSPLVEKGFSEDPPFGDPMFAERAREECPLYGSSRLREPHESCETVMGVLWGAFGRGVAGKAKEPTWAAIREGRNYIRDLIFDDVRSYLATHPDITGFDVEDHAEDWFDIGEKAADSAGIGNDITDAYFRQAWADVYGVGPYGNHNELTRLADRATEEIGSHMWAMLGKGIRSYGGAEKFRVEVGITAREHSRLYVLKNVILKDVVVPGDPTIYYGRWPSSDAKKCSLECGLRAAKKASQASMLTIGEGHFAAAWCEASRGYRIAARIAGYTQEEYNNKSIGCN